MLGRTAVSRATTQWVRATSQQSRRTMASAAAAANPFQFEVSDAQGIKIASRDDGAPTTSLALVVKAGSRYEPAPGIAHGLQHFTWKNTDRRSALRVQRESELLGGKVSTTLSRENIVLRAQFLRQDLPYFIEAIGDILTSTRYQPYVYAEETAPTVKLELERLHSSSAELAVENALGVAFHRGIGSPRLSTSKYVDQNSIAAYASQVFNKSNIALVASGAKHSELSKWTSELLKGVKTGSKVIGPATKYYGGETRQRSSAGNTFVVAFPGTASSPNYKAEYKVLTHLLGGQETVKWNTSSMLLGKAVADLSGVSAVANNLHFSDAGLLYITVTGPDALLEKAGAAVVSAVNGAVNASAEDVKKAIAQAKFDVYAEAEERSLGLELVGQSLLVNGTVPQAESIVKAIEAVTVDSVKNAAKAILAGRATFAAVGDLHVLPFAEDIGLKV